MRIILFGGSFNPIHNGHIEAAKRAMQTIGARKVIFVPSFSSFDEKNYPDYTEPADRLNMIKEVIKNVPNFFVDDYEIRQQQKCFTIDTVKYFRKKFYEDNIYFLMGYDQLVDFHKWKDYKEILKIVSIICIKRNDIEVDKSKFSPHDFLFLDNSGNNISSTNIRNSLVREDIPYRVLKYVNDNGIYVKSRIAPFMSDKRFKHSLRVGIMCYEVMKRYDPKNAIKGWVAGVYHDICKEFSQEKTESLAYKQYNLPKVKSWKVLHAPLGKLFLRDFFKFDDEMVLNAIANHTIPDRDKSKLTILDKALFCCDKLEPERTEKELKNIKELRNMLYQDLHKTFDKIIETLVEMYKE